MTLLVLFTSSEEPTGQVEQLAIEIFHVDMQLQFYIKQIIHTCTYMVTAVLMFSLYMQYIRVSLTRFLLKCPICLAL